MRTTLPTILIVEDNGLLRYDIVEAFRAAGWEVLESASAEAAIAILSAGQRVALVFTDIQLAGPLTGWDVADAFREAHSDMPIIYTSGNVTDRSRQVARSQFFAKPYDRCRHPAGIARVFLT